MNINFDLKTMPGLKYAILSLAIYSSPAGRGLSSFGAESKIDI